MFCENHLRRKKHVKLIIVCASMFTVFLLLQTYLKQLSPVGDLDRIQLYRPNIYKELSYAHPAPFQPSYEKRFWKNDCNGNSSLPADNFLSYKMILSYTSDFKGFLDFEFGYGSNGFSKACCTEPRCLMTSNRSLVPFHRFDALIFHFYDPVRIKLPTDERTPEQRWILYDAETPSVTSYNKSRFNGVFNWTFTYRKDSDIWRSYGAIDLIQDQKFAISSFDYASGKSNKAVWAVSHCMTKSDREMYVEMLSEYYPIDVYGGCGQLKCYGKECMKYFAKDYKFYLSFENALCRDYITEKFFDPLRAGLIPVVYGYGDYASVAPPHSYISAMDFGSPKILAEYLKYLSQNDTAYNEYFEWKKKYRVLSDWEAKSRAFCELCYKLHNDKTYKVQEDLHRWFVEKSQCKDHPLVQGLAEKSR